MTLYAFRLALQVFDAGSSQLDKGFEKVGHFAFESGCKPEAFKLHVAFPEEPSVEEI
jgi:hypothetical protein